MAGRYFLGSYFVLFVLRYGTAPINYSRSPLPQSIKSGFVLFIRAAAPVTARIHCVEGDAFNSHADKPTDFSFTGCVFVTLSQIRGHLQGGLRGRFITCLPVGLGQIPALATKSPK